MADQAWGGRPAASVGVSGQLAQSGEGGADALLLCPCVAPVKAALVTQLDPAAAKATDPVGHGRTVLMNARYRRL
jgi:hypothetical protein